MFDTYGDKVEFFIVYIREAHAIDSSSPMAFKAASGELVQDPVNAAERAEVASQCVKDLNLPMPALIDNMDDSTNQNYLGWPDRLYLVDKDGKLAYAGGRGPFFFSTEEMDEAIQRVLAR